MTENQTKWIEALRSGKYKQGNGVLKNDEKFCCLGVLCDVIRPDLWVDALGVPSDDGTHLKISTSDSKSNKYNVSDEFIPKELLVEIGINHKDAQTLAAWNDNGFSFDYIADALSKKFNAEGEGCEHLAIGWYR